MTSMSALKDPDNCIICFLQFPWTLTDQLVALDPCVFLNFRSIHIHICTHINKQTNKHTHGKIFKMHRRNIMFTRMLVHFQLVNQTWKPNKKKKTRSVDYFLHDTLCSFGVNVMCPKIVCVCVCAARWAEQAQCTAMRRYWLSCLLQLHENW